MKNITTKILFLAALVLFAADVLAQVPQGFNFQAVARDADGELIANTELGVRVSILQGDEDGTAVYTESQNPTTSAVGSFQIVIGEGTSEDDFSGIDWSSDNYYVKLEIDPAGGDAYEVLGTTRLLSVPYALLAKDVINGTSGSLSNIEINTSQGDTSFAITAEGTEPILGAMQVRSSTLGSNRGIDSRVTSLDGSIDSQLGLYGRAEGAGTGTHFGVYGIALGPNSGSGDVGRRYGLYGYASSTGRENIGGFGIGLGPGDGEVVPIGDPREAEGNWGGYNIGFVGWARDNLNGNLGIRGFVYGDKGGRINIAGAFHNEATATGINNGVETLVKGSQTLNRGYFGVVDGTTKNIGMQMYVNNGTSNIGLDIHADTAAIFHGLVEINNDLQVNGEIRHTGDISQTSDRRLKENIQPLQNGLGTIMKLNPTTYNFRGNGDYNGLKLSTGMHYGLIAQEVEEVLPSLVKNNVHTYSEITSFGSGPSISSDTEITKTMEYKTMNYTELIPVLIKGMQEQQQLIEQQQKEIEMLKQKLNLK